jgi:N-acetylated-alpha-linked acidic dipeptidase
MKLAIFILTLCAARAQNDQSIRGFPSAAQSAQRTLEEKARQAPDPGRARTYMKRMSSEPHHAGSPASKAVAEYALGLFKEWGLEARIEEFEALLPYPTLRLVEMTAPVKFRAKMHEPPLKDDPDSTDQNQLPTYNAYAASGDVTGPLLYVNYGVPADYERLEQMGISAKGKIVIARYGQSWRGTKAKTAQEHGAIGCLIYSDPKEDGYYQGDVFPKGPYRPAESAQRGSVMDMPFYVGDPLSPGWASEAGSKKLKREEAASIMRIPVLPLSAADAQPLLAHLGGPVAPPDWRGALPLTYHIGPGEAAVHLKTDYDWTSKPLYNVIARMPGSTLPDEWVIYGNHHDAWVNGAADPVSGAVALLETARALAEVRKSGWRPKRTIVFALWDGEEFGLIGSTEWVEKHRDALKEKAVAYLNSDMNAGGAFSAGGSPILDRFIRQVLRDVSDPVTHAPLLQPGAKKEPFRLSPLGAGSDYVAFVHHLGIPSLNMGFNGAGNQGTYHSIFDSFAWFSRHMDKDLRYSRALAQVMAVSILRLSETTILPHEFTAVHRALLGAHDELKKQFPNLDLAAARQQIETLGDRSARYESAFRSAMDKAGPASNVTRLNRAILASERTLTREAGLPGRPFYKHLLQAPGSYTGYSARTLPAIREFADAGQIDEANRQAVVLAEALRGMNAHVEQLTAMLGQL